MGRCPWTLWICAVMLAAACTPDRIAVNDDPILIEEVTVAPETPSPAPFLNVSPSPTRQIILTPTATVLWALAANTLDSGLVLLTPTLPPSKTPTPTSTQTATLVATPRPTLPPTIPPVILPATPIPGLVPIPTALGATPVSSIPCSVAWFFTGPAPAVCPLNPPLVSAASFQQFQGGFMLWVGQQDAIYMFYDGATFPRWQVYNDAYQEGIPETDPAFDNAPPGTWQPRRGFGLLWRTQEALRSRLGWALSDRETAFTTQVQIASDGTIFLLEPRGGVISLTADGSSWARYGG